MDSSDPSGSASAVSLLEDIVFQKRREAIELAELPAPTTFPEPRAVNLRDPRALTLITEIKRKSPSAGVLSTTLTVEERALAYAQNGASMISVLCDSTWFDGSWDHVKRTRHALDDARLAVPILAKEFVVDPVQVRWAAASGASAVLVIVRIVDDASLHALMVAARAHELKALVEVTNEDELARALTVGATIIGVNARDLDTLAMDRARAERVLARIPSAVTALHLSGIKIPADVDALKQTRADGALVGETLMREPNPIPALRALRAATTR